MPTVANSIVAPIPLDSGQSDAITSDVASANAEPPTGGIATFMIVAIPV